MLLGAVQFCRDWIEMETPKSKTFVSGPSGGWLTSRMSHPSADIAASSSGSSLIRWWGALSCCTQTVLSSGLAAAGGRDNWLLISGITWSISIFL